MIPQQALPLWVMAIKGWFHSPHISKFRVISRTGDKYEKSEKLEGKKNWKREKEYDVMLKREKNWLIDCHSKRGKKRNVKKWEEENAGYLAINFTSDDCVFYFIETIS